MSPIRTLALHAIAFSLAAVFASQNAHATLLFGRIVPDPPQTEADEGSREVDVSPDGRTLVFTSDATNWLPSANFANAKIIATDLHTGLIQHVSLTTAGAFVPGIEPTVSRGGRYVSFRSNSSALDVGVPTTGWQIVRKDRLTGELKLVSASAGGAPADREARDASISGDGRYVAFASGAFNLGYTNTPNAYAQVYVKDLDTGAIDAASRTVAGTLPDEVSQLTRHALTEDGRFVVFSNNADGMAAGYSNTSGSAQVYLRDVVADVTELVSRNSAGQPGDRSSDVAAISPGGRFVSFRSSAFNLGGTPQTNSSVYLRDRVTGVTTPIPLPTVDGKLANSCRESDVSDIGTVIMTCFFPTPVRDQVVWFIPGVTATPVLISSDANDVAGNGASGDSVAVDSSGLSMAFQSAASNLVAGDGNTLDDIFVLVDDSVLFGIFSDGFED